MFRCPVPGFGGGCLLWFAAGVAVGVLGYKMVEAKKLDPKKLTAAVNNVAESLKDKEDK